jgi:hypothetical protein
MEKYEVLVAWLREGAKPTNDVTPKARRLLCAEAAKAIEELLEKLR